MTVFEPVSINGQTMWALLDTGSDSSYLLDSSAASSGVGKGRPAYAGRALGVGVIPEGQVQVADVVVELAGCARKAQVQLRSREDFPVLGSTAEVRPGIGRPISAVIGNDVLDELGVGIQMSREGHTISAVCAK